MVKCINGDFDRNDGKFYLVGAMNKVVVMVGDDEMTKEEIIDFTADVLAAKGVTLRTLLNYTVGIEVTQLTDNMIVGSEVVIKSTGETGVLKNVTMGMFGEVDTLCGKHFVSCDLEDLELV